MKAFDLDRVGGLRGLHALVDEVLACGQLALHIYRQGASVVRKPDRSPVTQADQDVEERLRGFLLGHHPGTSFLGEETGRSADHAALRWVVDPIDGTRAFIRGVPTWSVLVGLEADGVPVLGVAYMPAAEDLFVGVLGGGATHNGRPIHLSEVEALADAMVTHGALAQFTDTGRAHLLPRLAEATYSQRGFADFDGYRQVLLGRADAMIDPGVQPYDVCPAAVLVREAGGRFTSIEGEETIHGRSGLASNGLVHDALVGLLR